MEKVLDVYKRPYSEKHPVICMDESPEQLIGEKRISPAQADGAKVEDYEYVRAGTCNLFVAVEPLGGRRLVKVTEHRRSTDWAEFMKEISEWCPEAEEITLIMDNLNTHKAASLYERFKPEDAKAIWDRFEFVYTPVHGSWLNMAEIEINVLHGQCLSRRIDTIEKVKAEIKAWQENRNNKKAKIDWGFTTEDSRIKLKKLYPTLSK